MLLQAEIVREQKRRQLLGDLALFFQKNKQHRDKLSRRLQIDSLFGLDHFLQKFHVVFVGVSLHPLGHQILDLVHLELLQRHQCSETRGNSQFRIRMGGLPQGEGRREIKNSSINQDDHLYLLCTKEPHSFPHNWLLKTSQRKCGSERTSKHTD